MRMCLPTIDILSFERRIEEFRSGFFPCQADKHAIAKGSAHTVMVKCSKKMGCNIYH
jgi:hypothetical protein